MNIDIEEISESMLRKVQNENKLAMEFDRRIDEMEEMQHRTDIHSPILGYRQNPHTDFNPFSTNYTPQYVARVFTKTSEDPKFFADSIGGIVDTSFTVEVQEKIRSARDILKSLHINPYKRISGNFHINTVQLITNDLNNRILALYDDQGNITPNINRNMLIGYAAEIQIITTIANNLSMFIDQLK